MSGFKVSIIDGKFSACYEDTVPETDIIDMLEFDETQIEDLYRTHAAIQARWEQIAINMRNSYESFQDGFERKWWAHNKRFGKFLALGYGEKTPTMDTIKDNVVLIYSQDTSEFERSKFSEIAYNAAVLKDKSYLESKEDFVTEMFKYIRCELPWYYEGVITTSKELNRNFLTVQNIAKKLDSRSYHIKDLKDLMMAKHGNMPMTDRQDNQISGAVQKISGYGPNNK